MKKFFILLFILYGEYCFHSNSVYRCSIEKEKPVKWIINKPLYTTATNSFLLNESIFTEFSACTPEID